MYTAAEYSFDSLSGSVNRIHHGSTAFSDAARNRQRSVSSCSWVQEFKFRLLKIFDDLILRHDYEKGIDVESVDRPK